MFNRQTHKPIVVEVRNGQWDAYSQNPIPTGHDQWLLSLIRLQGGINESVTEGHYYFNAKKRLFGKLELSLVPFEKIESFRVGVLGGIDGCNARFGV